MAQSEVRVIHHQDDRTGSMLGASEGQTLGCQVIGKVLCLPELGLGDIRIRVQTLGLTAVWSWANHLTSLSICVPNSVVKLTPVGQGNC